MNEIPYDKYGLYPKQLSNPHNAFPPQHCFYGTGLLTILNRKQTDLCDLHNKSETLRSVW